jgi:hypothetical protein
MVMEYNVDEIRAYLLRMIANKNHRLSGMIDGANKFTSNRDPQKAKSYHDVFNKVAETFAGRSNTLDLEQIYEHIQANPKSRFNVYNYFDVDTLVAYNEYLTKFLSMVDLRAYECGRRRATMEDFSYGFSEVGKWLQATAGKEESGFYDKMRPMRIAKKRFKDKMIFNPQKPLSQSAFDKKYNAKACEQSLKNYLQDKHGQKVTSVKDPEYIEYTYKGESFRLPVVSKEYYTDQDARGVVDIVASGREGRLYRTEYSSGEIYKGDLYDFEGNIVQIDVGGEDFYPNSTYWKAKEPKIVDDHGMDQTTFF